MNVWTKQISKICRHKCPTKHKNVAYNLGGVNFGLVKKDITNYQEGTYKSNDYIWSLSRWTLNLFNYTLLWIVQYTLIIGLIVWKISRILEAFIIFVILSRKGSLGHNLQWTSMLAVTSESPLLLVALYDMIIFFHFKYTIVRAFLCFQN